MAFIMNSTLHVVPVDPTGVPTESPVQLTEHAADMPSWGGDSRTILYVSNGKLRTIQVDGTGGKNIPFDLTWKQAVPKGRTIIHAGGLWDGISPTIYENVDIVIVGNRIKEVRPHQAPARGDSFVDASNLTVMPGLWDPHVHPRLKDAMGPLMAILAGVWDHIGYFGWQRSLSHRFPQGSAGSQEHGWATTIQRRTDLRGSACVL